MRSLVAGAHEGAVPWCQRVCRGAICDGLRDLHKVDLQRSSRRIAALVRDAV
jgi:DNA-directed RNA polymerase specialized sigma subunit